MHDSIAKNNSDEIEHLTEPRMKRLAGSKTQQIYTFGKTKPLLEY